MSGNLNRPTRKAPADMPKKHAHPELSSHGKPHEHKLQSTAWGAIQARSENHERSTTSAPNPMQNAHTTKAMQNTQLTRTTTVI